MRREGMAAAAGFAAAIVLAGCGGGDDGRDRLVSRLADDPPLFRIYADLVALRSELDLPADADPSDYRRYVEFAMMASPLFSRLEESATAVLGLSEASEGATGNKKSVISTAADLGEVESDLRGLGWSEAENGALTLDEKAIALGDGTIAIADSAGDAVALLEEPSGEVPEELSDAEGSVITLWQYEPNDDCLRYVVSTDRPGSSGEVRFYPVGEPDADSVTPPVDETGGEATVEDDSLRIEFDQDETLDLAQLPALDALRGLLLGYDCGGP